MLTAAEIASRYNRKNSSWNLEADGPHLEQLLSGRNNRHRLNQRFSSKLTGLISVATKRGSKPEIVDPFWVVSTVKIKSESVVAYSDPLCTNYFITP